MAELDSPRRLRKRWLFWAFLAAWIGTGAWHTLKPMPPGTAVVARGTVANADVQFLHDLTSANERGEAVHEQQIFDAVARLIDEAESFVIADFFRFNDFMGAASSPHRPLSRELAARLIERKRARPGLAVLLITDPINDIYGSRPSPLLAQLRSAGIEVVVTDLDRLRDSNPAYSALWRLLARWWGTAAGPGDWPNPFASGPAERVTLRSWLALLNFKANHRKLIVADRADGSASALVTSANPHDASSAHSNVALYFTGALAQDIAASEMAIARFSGWRGHILYDAAAAHASEPEPREAVTLSFLTEAAIEDHLRAAIDATRNGDSVRIATFYLADRDIVHALLRAAQREVQVRLILDPNRDAFGRRKDGVPNRPAANELVGDSRGRIEVRWYRTHGEQFHTKLALITSGERFIATLGSANLTRRNLDNYNLEANLAAETAAGAPLAVEMSAYFERLWNNAGTPGSEYTAPFGTYRDSAAASYWRYRLMEATGLSTF